MFSVVGLIPYLDDNQAGELFIGFQNKSIPN